MPTFASTIHVRTTPPAALTSPINAVTNVPVKAILQVLVFPSKKKHGPDLLHNLQLPSPKLKFIQAIIAKSDWTNRVLPPGGATRCADLVVATRTKATIPTATKATASAFVRYVIFLL